VLTETLRKEQPKEERYLFLVESFSLLKARGEKGALLSAAEKRGVPLLAAQNWVRLCWLL